jgi:hypothetical protein
VVVAELAAIATGIGLAVLFTRYHQPGDARRGMATRAEAAGVLGISRLRSAREVIRPDLYARHRHLGPRVPSKPATGPTTEQTTERTTEQMR